MERKITNSEELAWRIRRDAIEMTHVSNGSHIACVLSVADIIAVLFAKIMNYDPENPKMDERDRLVLSKGHAGAAIYSALAEEGFFDVEELKTHYANGSRLSGHVSHKVPGIDVSTGSLGHGLPVAAGMAHSAKIDGKKHTVYVVLGDGECDEGSIWESALYANQYELNNLVAIVDHNKMQSFGYCEDTIKLEPLSEKWKSFGWNVVEIDGHNHEQLKNTFESIRGNNNNKPTVVIANTIKGKGISFMEGNIKWHYNSPQGDDYDNAVKELENQRLNF